MQNDGRLGGVSAEKAYMPQQGQAPGGAAEHGAALPTLPPEDSAILERYRALDALATAMFQAGVAVGIAGVTIGLTIVPRYGGVIITGGVLSLMLGLLAALPMIDFDESPPDAKRLRKKTTEVNGAALGLTFVILIAVVAFLILLAATS